MRQWQGPSLPEPESAFPDTRDRRPDTRWRPVHPLIRSIPGPMARPDLK